MLKFCMTVISYCVAFLDVVLRACQGEKSLLLRKSQAEDEERGQNKAVKVTSFPSLFWGGYLTMKSNLS